MKLGMVSGTMVRMAKLPPAATQTGCACSSAVKVNLSLHEHPNGNT
jgi:hypothetical protein